MIPIRQCRSGCTGHLSAVPNIPVVKSHVGRTDVSHDARTLTSILRDMFLLSLMCRYIAGMV